MQNCLIGKPAEILRLIERWPSHEPLRPSTLARRAGFADESGVRYYLRQLDQAGFIKRISTGRGVPQILQVTDEGRVAAGLSTVSAIEVQAPASFDVVAIPGKCGFRTVGAVDEADLQQLDMSHLFPHWRYDGLDHVVVAENDSMVAPEGRSNPDSIFPCDLVHTRDGICPGKLERVYVEYELPSGERECALKILERQGKWVILRSLNPAYPAVKIDGRNVTRCYIVLAVRGLVHGSTN